MWKYVCEVVVWLCWCIFFFFVYCIVVGSVFGEWIWWRLWCGLSFVLVVGMVDVDILWIELWVFFLNLEVESCGRCIVVGFVLDLCLIECFWICMIGFISVMFLYVDCCSLEVCLLKYNYSRWSWVYIMSRII